MANTEQANGQRTWLLTSTITILICGAMFMIGYLLAKIAPASWFPIFWLIVLITGGAARLNYRRPSETQRREHRRNLHAGWKPDPCEESDERWWDGTRFTTQILGRLGTDPATYEKTAVQDGLTLCPFDSKKQYVSQRSALTAAQEIYEKKKQTKEETQADGDKKSRREKRMRAYLHNSKGPDRPGCECWHLTSDTN